MGTGDGSIGVAYVEEASVTQYNYNGPVIDATAEFVVLNVKVSRCSILKVKAVSL